MGSQDHPALASGQLPGSSGESASKLQGGPGPGPRGSTSSCERESPVPMSSSRDPFQELLLILPEVLPTSEKGNKGPVLRWGTTETSSLNTEI